MDTRVENQFDLAASEAEQELHQKLEKMTKEEREGIAKMAAWWKANYMKAGHKRLGRIVANLHV
jgi:hypothetical protein